MLLGVTTLDVASITAPRCVCYGAGHVAALLAPCDEVSTAYEQRSLPDWSYAKGCDLPVCNPSADQTCTYAHEIGCLSDTHQSLIIGKHRNGSDDVGKHRHEDATTDGPG